MNLAHSEDRIAVVEVHQISYVLAVHEAGSFTKAAERCHVSQPALSAAVKKLEDELGGAFFLRERTGVSLTPLGELLLPRFIRTSGELASINELAERYHLLDKAPLKIGVLSTVGPRWLAPLIKRFRDRAPGIELEIRTTTRPQLLAWLEDAEVEAALGSATDADALPGWMVSRELCRERYVVALPPGHRLADRSAVDLASLDREPYIDRLGCELREQVAEACTDAGATLYASYRTEHDHWIESLVDAGIGFAFLPEHTLSLGALSRPLVAPELTRKLCLWRHVDRARSPGARCFWDTIAAQATSANCENA